MISALEVRFQSDLKLFCVRIFFICNSDLLTFKTLNGNYTSSLNLILSMVSVWQGHWIQLMFHLNYEFCVCQCKDIKLPEKRTETWTISVCPLNWIAVCMKIHGFDDMLQWEPRDEIMRTKHMLNKHRGHTQRYRHKRNCSNALTETNEKNNNNNNR